LTFSPKIRGVLSGEKKKEREKRKERDRFFSLFPLKMHQKIEKIRN